MSFQIGNAPVGKNFRPFIIAEMSGNHNGSLEHAMAIVRSAKKCGASAIKLQTYTPDTLTINCHKPDFLVDSSDSLWKGRYLYDLYKEAFTPWEWHAPLFELANELDLIFFSSVFDESSVDFLETLNVPAYKIASFENSHLPLIEKAASTGKPLIISTGMASLEELEETVSVARQSGCEELMLLKCTSNYPANQDGVNLRTLEDLRHRFNCEIGFSDHTLGPTSAISAVALGAVAIEKHITLSGSDGGVDSAFSAEEADFSLLVEGCNAAWESLGKISYGPTEEEIASIKFRRSIYAITDISDGEIFTTKNIGIIRPGYGLHPRHFEQLLGNTAKKDFSAGDRIDSSCL